MRSAWTLMTALPPTKGHGNLIRFTRALGTIGHVILCTQPGEPLVSERQQSIEAFCREIGVRVHRIEQSIQQEPCGEDDHGFWAMWLNFFLERGFAPGDYLVTSESYGAKLAAVLNGVFMPYDIARDIEYTKATLVRQDLWEYFDTLLPEFQHWLQCTVTIFGAESTGKTTLSKDLAATLNGMWLPEWARPYLEAVGPELSVSKMYNIFDGQAALQAHKRPADSPVTIQDTDLFSTLGYWENWSQGTVAPGLRTAAQALKSDLYLITPSNIPFEPDPLRYGGDQREIPDHKWIELCQREGLNYRVLESRSMQGRILEAQRIVFDFYEQRIATKIAFHREGREYDE